MNFYRTLKPYINFWFIVSPDDRYIDVLASQGIHFIKYAE